MDQSDTTGTCMRCWTVEKGRAGAADAEPGGPTLTAKQRLLAWATAAAILMSGLNALVQVWRVMFGR